jgi:DNA-binding CsgD family transcriptional regulator
MAVELLSKKEVIMLSLVGGGLSYEEVGARLMKTELAIKAAMFRARMKVFQS